MKLLNMPLFAALLLTGASAAHAQLNFVLTPTQTGAVGTTLTYTGALSNQGSGAVFLNGSSLSFGATGITADDSPFFNGAPLSLAPAGSAGSTYSGAFFTLAIGPTARPGTYLGTFGVVGGADALAGGTLASRNFSVTVAAVPEASTGVSLGLLFSLCAGCLLAARRRRADTAA